MKQGWYFLWVWTVVVFGMSVRTHAQTPTADTVKIRQISYSTFLKEEEERRRQALQQKNVSQVTVVTYDSKGKKIEKEAKKESPRLAKTSVTTTSIILPPVLNRKFSADTINRDSVSLKVVKSKNRLQVYHKGHMLTSYKCVFGPNHLLQKECEGDRRTPEGTFTIQNCKDHQKWDKFLLLDYPNAESYRLFDENKRKGSIPANARIGGSIGIHGIWANGDNVIDMKHNWTDGCVSLKNADVEELSRIIKPGVTQVTITK